MKNPKHPVSIETLESFDNKYKSASEGDSSSYRGCLPSPQNKESIWVEYKGDISKVQPFNKLRLPNHQFIRREFLEESPSGSWTKRNKRMH
jgi:hypothetical protein